MSAACRTNDGPKDKPIGQPQGHDHSADQVEDGGTILSPTEITGVLYV